MPSFVDTLLEVLTPPSCLCAAPEDELWVDVAPLRSLLMGALRRPLSVSGAPARIEVIGALALWVRDGGLDAYLQATADTLISLGVVREQEVLNRFLRAAVLDQLGSGDPLGEPAAARLSTTDRLLLDMAVSAPLGSLSDLRVPVRRYARALGLLSNPDRGEPRGCTDAGATVRSLPPELVLPYLITLEGLSYTGGDDPHRAPRQVYHHLFLRGEVTAPPRRPDLMPRGDGPGAGRLLPESAAPDCSAARALRWLRMGLCEERPGPQGGAAPGPLRAHLTTLGRRALEEALRTPPSEVVRLCNLQHRRSRDQALRLLRPRRSGPVATQPRLPPSVPDQPIADHHILPASSAFSAHPAPADRAGHDAARTLDAPAAPPPARGTSSLAARLRPLLQPDDAPFEVEPLCRAALRELRANPRFHNVAAQLVVRQPLRPTSAATPPSEGPPLMNGSRRALRRLVAELLAMAAHSIAGQSVARLLLELTATATEVCLWIHDNGPGIPVSQRPLIFAERPAGGVLPRYLLGGLRRTIEDTLHGRIEIAAPRLGGASFRITLPRDGRSAQRLAAMLSAAANR